MDYYWHYESPLGGMTMASDGLALTGLWFDRRRFSGAGSEPELQPLPVFEETSRWLDVYFGGGLPSFTPQLALRGTPFRQSVWEILMTIPYGHTETYGEIAGRLAKQRATRVAAQAVGGAVCHNPVAIIIPCHRVIGADGSLTGYAAGLERKSRLLQLEK